MKARQYIVMSLLSGIFGLLLYLVFGGHGVVAFNEPGRYTYHHSGKVKFDTKTGHLWKIIKLEGRYRWVRVDDSEIFAERYQ